VMRLAMTLCLLGSSLLFGCGPQRLPPGMPPPEYETRSPPPWPPGAAGAAGQPANAATAPSATSAAAGSPAAGSGGVLPGPSPAAPAE